MVYCVYIYLNFSGEYILAAVVDPTKDVTLKLMSKKLESSRNTHMCFSLSYYVYGEKVGTLSIKTIIYGEKREFGKSYEQSVIRSIWNSHDINLLKWNRLQMTIKSSEVLYKTKAYQVHSKNTNIIRSTTQ